MNERVYDVKKEQSKKAWNKRLTRILAWGVGILLAVFVIQFSLKVWIDLIEVSEIGQQFRAVYMKDTLTKLALTVAGFLITFVLIFLSLLWVRSNMRKISPSLSILKKRSPVVLLSLVVSMLAGNVLREEMYQKFLFFMNGTEFGMADPIFSQDVGYYVFIRPFLLSVVDSLMGLWVTMTIIVLALYAVLYLGRNLGDWHLGKLRSETGIIAHNLVNFLGILVLKCLGCRFSAEGLLFKGGGRTEGAGFVDVNIWMHYYNIIPFVLLALVVLALIFIWRKKYKLSAIAIAVFPAIFLTVSLVAGGVQLLYVQPNEINLEEPYVSHNIDMTRKALNLDRVEEHSFEVKNDLTAADIEENAPTVDNIRVLDLYATEQVSTQIQSIRNYYQFTDTDLAVYDINGQPTEVFLSARELDSEYFENTQSSYINSHYRYTHGMGLVMGPVNQATAEGQPDYMIKDVPPKSLSGAPEITEPRIYYGEKTDTYSVVKLNDMKELDYSEGQTDYEYVYEGTGGVPMSFLNRLVYAFRYGDFKLLISNLIQSDSRLLMNRQVVERVEKILPEGLLADPDAYLVISDEGRLMWVVDLYTSSIEFPYAQTSTMALGDEETDPEHAKSFGVKYVRNPAKAVVDAYHGTVKLYITDETEPMISTYQRIYPSLFEEEEMPRDIYEHIRYPEALFNVQSEAFEMYHMTSAVAFLNKSDAWQIAKERDGGEVTQVEGYYNLMRLPGSREEEELMIMLPYTMANKDNMVGWLGAHAGPEDYGKLVLYTFPMGRNIYGTLQIENRIEADAEISRETTLWGQNGSKVVRGNMLVVPVDESLLYVEPVYIQATSDTAVPELKRVIVAYDDKIVMQNTLREALQAIFGDAVTAKVPNETVQTVEDMIGEAVTHFNAVKEAAGEDWEAFGRNMQALEDTLNRLSGEQGAEGSEATLQE